MAFLCLAVICYVGWASISCNGIGEGFVYGLTGLCGIFGGVYCFCGCTKKASAWYRMFGEAMIFLGLVIIFNGFASEGNLATIAHILWFGAISGLVIGLDLGKVKTFGLCVVILASSIIDVIFGSSDPIVIGMLISQLVITVIYCTMSIAKFIDKASRGSK